MEFFSEQTQLYYLRCENFYLSNPDVNLCYPAGFNLCFLHRKSALFLSDKGFKLYSQKLTLVTDTASGTQLDLICLRASFPISKPSLSERLIFTE